MLQVKFMPNQFENTDKNFFFRKYRLPNITQEETGILNIRITIKKN